jgi:hypothetical protein
LCSIGVFYHGRTLLEEEREAWEDYAISGITAHIEHKADVNLSKSFAEILPNHNLASSLTLSDAEKLLSQHGFQREKSQKIAPYKFGVFGGFTGDIQTKVQPIDQARCRPSVSATNLSTTSRISEFFSNLFDSCCCCCRSTS